MASSAKLVTTRNPLSVIALKLQTLYSQPDAPRAQIDLLEELACKVSDFSLDGHTITSQEVVSLIDTYHQSQQDASCAIFLKDLRNNILGIMGSNKETPNEGYFPYHQKLFRKVVTSDCSKFTLCNLISLDGGRTIFTLLITKERSSVDVLESPPDSSPLGSHASLIYPIDKICYSVNKTQRYTYVYNKVTSLEAYMKENDISDAAFKPIVKGFITGLVWCEDHGQSGLLINAQTLVVHKNVGGILCICTRDEGSSSKGVDTTSRMWFEDMKKLKESIVPSDVKLSTSSTRVSSDVKPSTSSSLVTLFSCMYLARTKYKRKRLLKAPYFLSDEDKTCYFILSMYLASKDLPVLKTQMSTSTNAYHWQDKIVRGKHKEMDAMLYKGGYADAEGFQFLRLLRYGQRHFTKEWNALNNARCADESKVWIPCPSPLIANPKLLLEVIDGVNAEFLDRIFLATYIFGESMIPILDVPS